jgi:hypothetical protein
MFLNAEEDFRRLWNDLESSENEDGWTGKF